MIITTNQAIKYLKSIDIIVSKKKNKYLVVGHEVFGTTRDIIETNKELIHYANDWKEIMEME